MFHYCFKFLVSFSQSVHLTALVAALAFLLVGAAFDDNLKVRAADGTIAGYTNGCFNCNPPPVPNTSVTQTATLFGLTYVNSTFSGTSAAGVLGFGGNPIAPPTQNVDNLGAISLADSNATYSGNSFTLRVTFTTPTGVNPSQSQLFTANLSGSVTSTGNGGVLIDFDNRPFIFTFGVFPNINGSFLLRVNDVALNPGHVASISGYFNEVFFPPPTAATVSLSGRITKRIMDNNDRGLRVLVSITDSTGQRRYALTNPFGYYRFRDVPVETYIIEVRSKQYAFTPQVVNINQDITNLNFKASP